MSDDAYARGREAGIDEASQQAKQAGYSDGWNQAVRDVLEKLPMPTRHEGYELGLPPDTPSSIS